MRRATGPSGGNAGGVRESRISPDEHAILLVGPGRAGQALARAWHAAGVPVAWVVGRREEPARQLAAAVGARPLAWERLRREGLPGPWPPVLVLAVPDRALEPVAQALAGVLAAVPPARRPRHALHLSGALGLEPLTPLARLGLAPEVFHPLLPLPGGPAGRDRLAGGYVTVVYAPGQGRAPVGPALARAVGATPVPWPGATAEQLALYHAAATLAANGVTALLWAAEELMGLAGYPGVGAAGALGASGTSGAAGASGAASASGAADASGAAGASGARGGAGDAGGRTGEPAEAVTAPADGGPREGTAPVGRRTGGVATGTGASGPRGEEAVAATATPAPGAEDAVAATGAPDARRPAVVALAAAALAAVAERGPLAALTGPIARGDVPTVQRHLRHLDALARRAEAEAGPATWYRRAAALVVAAARRLPEPPPALDEIARLVGLADDRPVPEPGPSPGRSLPAPAPGAEVSQGPQGSSREGMALRLPEARWAVPATHGTGASGEHRPATAGTAPGGGLPGRETARAIGPGPSAGVTTGPTAQHQAERGTTGVNGRSQPESAARGAAAEAQPARHAPGGSAATDAPAQRVTVRTVLESKQQGRPVVMVTAYDYPFARLADAAGVDMILVGDSLGNVVLGYPSTVFVTLDDMVHHTKAVRRGVQRALLVADLPFLTFHLSVDEALKAAGRLVQEGGAEAVKLEGAGRVAEVVHRLTEAGIPVVGHLGLLPQRVHALGGYRVQGRDEEEARRLLDQALALEQAGAFALVLEMVPRELAASITRRLRIPTIGIGAGPDCDGQVLVIHDLLGLTHGRVPRFVRRYAELGRLALEALQRYAADVRNRTFPTDEHSYHLAPDVAQRLADEEGGAPYGDR